MWFTVTGSWKGQSHERHAKPYSFILHIMVRNRSIFGNSYPFYTFKKNPYNGWVWRKFIFLIGDAFIEPEASLSGHLSSFLYPTLEEETTVAKFSLI